MKRAWQSIRQSWPTLNIVRKILIVLFFPLVYLILVCLFGFSSLVQKVTGYDPIALVEYRRTLKK